MALIQMLGCEINIGGDRDNTVVKDQFDPVSYPEYLVLQAVHGGVDHVHGAVVVGEAELDPNAERERLSLKYGQQLVMGLFPGALAMMPVGDASLPTLDEVKAGEAASAEARAKTRKNTKAAVTAAQNVAHTTTEEAPAAAIQSARTRLPDITAA